MTPPSKNPAPQFLREQAETLVDKARIVAVGSFTRFGDQIPLIRKLRMDDWEFFMTVAGVFIAASTLKQTAVADEIRDGLMELVTTKAHDWDPNSVRAFDDCKRMFEQGYHRLSSVPDYQRNLGLVGADAVGMWIAWNVLQRRPESSEEMQLVRLSGVAVTHAFANYWRQA